MANYRHRLRKYKRRKDAAQGDHSKWRRIAELYWRYWHKVYGPHVSLWGENNG